MKTAKIERILFLWYNQLAKVIRHPLFHDGIMGSLLIIFDPYSTFVSLRKKRPSVLPVGATQHQLLLRESVSHYVLLYQDFAPSKDFLFHNSAEETD